MTSMPARPPWPTDEDLLARWKTGEESAFAELFGRYNAAITRYATRMLGNADDGHDAAVDTFVRVVDGRISAARSVRALLFTTVHRLCLDRLRRRARWGRVRRLWAAAPPPTTSPLAEAEERQDRHRIAVAIAALPDGHKAAVLLVYEECLSTAEAAVVLGITATQLRSQLAYARRLIRSHVEDS